MSFPPGLRPSSPPLLTDAFPAAEFTSADDPFGLSTLLDPFTFSDPAFTWPSLSETNFADPDNDSDPPPVPRPVGGSCLSDRMLKALSLFKVNPEGGFLAQVWMPVKQGGEYVLSTSEQPYLLDQILAGYREVSRAFTFSPREAPGALPGLPGRVFMSGLPEWTSNVGYYSRLEYLRADFAASHEVRGSLAVPVFDENGRRCCAVLELVTTKEKSNFDSEMENVCNALQAVGLGTTNIRTQQQISALTEILDVLRAVCHAHMLPLALTWIPSKGAIVEEMGDGNTSFMDSTMLRVEESACYVNDVRMQGFQHACAEHTLEKGQGPAGKALLSNQAFFTADVQAHDIREYPLAHHARKYGLHAAVAIRLRSTYTGDDDYVLELFLPVNCKGGTEQQLLLDSLSSTMQKICRSLRRVLDDEGVVTDAGKVDIPGGELASSPSTDMSSQHSQGTDQGLQSQLTDRGTELADNMPSGTQNVSTNEHTEDPYREPVRSRLPRNSEKKRSALEKNISLSVLQQYFSGSLKDAAKSIGVCPTTLKRICRAHGISRWPSRKIKKVNRSLRKIQTVIDSVEGVEGSLKYDPATGCLVAAVSSSDKPTLNTLGVDLMPMSCTDRHESMKPVTKLEREDSPDRHQIETSGHLQNPYRHGYETHKTSPRDLCLESFDSHFTSPSTICTGAVDDFSARVDASNALAEQNLPTSSSSTTDSSSSSSLSCPPFQKRSKSKECIAEGVTAITVKATYKEDTTRFKVSPTLGCNQLFEELGKRFKLQTGTFQLKYMDDEEEWVMLASDSDWLECIDVRGSMGSHTIKLLVRDGCSVIGQHRLW